MVEELFWLGLAATCLCIGTLASDELFDGFLSLWILRQLVGYRGVRLIYIGLGVAALVALFLPS